MSPRRPDLGPRRPIDESDCESRPPALQENDESFFVTTVLSRDATHIDLATVSWEKLPLVVWWRRVGGEFSTHLGSPPTGPGPLPSLVGECTDDTWSGMPFGTPDANGGETAVWTGTEMIVWGGAANFGGGTIRDTGGLYNPATDTWRVTVSAGNLPQARSDHTAVWTGRESHLGRDGKGQRAQSATRRRQSIRSTHRRMSPISQGLLAPQARTGHTAVWSGSEMLVWGGSMDGPTNTGGRYDPSTDSWREMDHGTSTPAPRDNHTAIWSGQEMVVWGGLGSTRT